MTVTWEIRQGDALERLRELPDESVQCCVTSPPYFGLRDYGSDGQIGLESSPAEFVAALVAVFVEVRRVLRTDGTLWVNMGDSYCNIGHGKSNRGEGKGAKGHRETEGTYEKGRGFAKHKDLLGIPWLLAFALRSDGWYLRSDIIWAKPNPMPESVTDRPTSAHEHLFLLAKSRSYFYDAGAIREAATVGNHPHRTVFDNGRGHHGGDKPPGTNPHLGLRRTMGPEAGRNKRNVWEIATQPYPDAHFATFPPKLVEPCILAGSAPGDEVLDPFAGSGTTGVVSLRHGRSFVGIELNPEYCALARRRICDDAPLLNTPAEASAA